MEPEETMPKPRGNSMEAARAAKIAKATERDAELNELRSQVSGLTVLVRQVLSEREQHVALSPADVAKAEAKMPPLEPRESERDRILAAWKAEPKVQIFIAPDENDRRAAAALAAQKLPPKFPDMIFQINGVQLAVPKGKPTQVPESVAALYGYMLDPWTSMGTIKPITFEEAEALVGL